MPLEMLINLTSIMLDYQVYLVLAIQLNMIFNFYQHSKSIVTIIITNPVNHYQDINLTYPLNTSNHMVTGNWLSINNLTPDFQCTKKKVTI